MSKCGSKVRVAGQESDCERHAHRMRDRKRWGFVRHDGHVVLAEQRQAVHWGDGADAEPYVLAKRVTQDEDGRERVEDVRRTVA